MTPHGAGAVEARSSLAALYARLRDAGCAAPADVGGQLIRPLLAVAGAQSLGVEKNDAFWSAVAAVQLAHEASLLHDDVIDGATVRRSVPTVAAARGVAAALVEGDHLLTTAYRLAAATGSLAFANAFARAVERTVAGEKLQGRAAGLRLDLATYRRIVGQKSGELLGCALAAAPLVKGAACADAWYVLGRRIGTLYQMLDDLLDYCPGAATGKVALVDYRQGRWTWPLSQLGVVGFDADPGAVAARFAEQGADGDSPLRRCLAEFRREAQRLRVELDVHLKRGEEVAGMLDDWENRAAAGVAAAEQTARRERARAELNARLEAVADVDACFRHNSRSFSFAAKAFPQAFRRQVAELYTFCRFTDDLADATAGLSAEQRLALLDEWEHVTRESWRGARTGVRLSDTVMRSAAAAGVPFSYVEALIEGMRMDVRGSSYETLDDLRVYSYRVAGVVGQWLTRLCGVHDADVLERAAQLGHGMQLTNILRDVGEDLRDGRLYLPAAALRAAGIRRTDLEAAALPTRRPARRRGGGRPVASAPGAALPSGWPDLVEQLMAVADRDYAAALEAVPALPPAFRRAVVIAAHVYRGIHEAIRRNGYDNLTRRATTSLPDKLRLAAAALVRRPAPPLPAVTPQPPAAPRPLPRAGLQRAGRTTFMLLLITMLPTALPTAAAAQRPPAEHLAEMQAAAAAAPDDPAIGLDLLRALYFSAVDDAALVRVGRYQVERLRTAAGAGGASAALLEAYDGAFHMLEARHGSWPHARLRAVRRGLDRLDRAVERAPDDSEVRYLRLVSTHYLPGFFGRREGARADLRTLARLLAEAPPGVPRPLHHVMTDFIDRNGG